MTDKRVKNTKDIKSQSLFALFVIEFLLVYFYLTKVLSLLNALILIIAYTLFVILITKLRFKSKNVVENDFLLKLILYAIIFLIIEFFVGVFLAPLILFIQD